MLPLLVWLAGCVAGVWYIVHAGYGHFAVGFALCCAVSFWIIGGANWIGQKLGNVAVRRMEAPSAEPYATGLRSTEQERELLRKAASLHQKAHEG
jgi:hypothetical protein